MKNLIPPVRILLVDDSPEFLESAMSFLSGNSELKVVGSAASGHEALEQVQELEPDLVLMDLSMPGMGGIEATRCLKAEHDGALRIVILTLDDDSEYRSAATSAQADGLIKKSEFGTELLPMIEMLFSQDGSAEIEQAAQ